MGEKALEEKNNYCKKRTLEGFLLLNIFQKVLTIQ